MRIDIVQEGDVASATVLIGEQESYITYYMYTRGKDEESTGALLQQLWNCLTNGQTILVRVSPVVVSDNDFETDKVKWLGRARWSAIKAPPAEIKGEGIPELVY